MKQIKWTLNCVKNKINSGYPSDPVIRLSDGKTNHNNNKVIIIIESK